jgi:hypothetical protein
MSLSRKLEALIAAGAALQAIARPAQADGLPDAVEVRIASDHRDIGIYERTPMLSLVPMLRGRSGATSLALVPTYTPVCSTMPCEVRIAPGLHILAMSREGGTVVEAQHPVLLKGPSLISTTYTDRSGERAFGYVLAIASIVVGSGMMATSRKTALDCSGPANTCSSSTATDGGMLVGGIVVFGGGLLAGSYIANLHDLVSFAVTPLAVSAPGQREGTGTAGISSGIAATITF